jgi:hypothetical protein
MDSPIFNNKNKINHSGRSSLDDPIHLSNKVIMKQIIGFIIYFIIFIIYVPYLLIKNKYFGILTGYIPNVDMIATVLGFQMKDVDYPEYFKYLYNPSTSTIYGLMSQTIINYLALLGTTLIIAYYTMKNKSIVKGWSRAFIMIPVTYLIPGNFIAYYMHKFNNYLDKHKISHNKYLKNGLVYGLGVIVILFFIFTEKFLNFYMSNIISTFLSKHLDI